MRRAIVRLTLSLCVLSTLAAFAGAQYVTARDDKNKKDDKERIFDAPYDKVWDACIASASENFIIDHSEKDSGILSFHSGISFTSAGFSVG